MYTIPWLRLFAAALLLVGCTTPRTPDTLRVGAQEEPDSLNPALANLVVSNDVFNLVFDGLVRFDDRGRPIPDLAVALPTRANGGVSSDGLTITYHLRRGVRWQDGVAFTSRDVAFTWHALMNPRNNVPTRIGYDQIARVDTPNADTVVLHLKKPYAPYITLFSCEKQGAILPAHLLERLPDLNRAAFNHAPIGTGPYTLVHWAHGDRLIFERSRYASPAPRIARIEYIFVGSQSTLLNALRAGDIDLYLNMPPIQARDIANSRRFALSIVSSIRWEHLTFNVRPGSGPQSDPRVRRAIAMAIDPVRIRHLIFFDTGGVAPLDQAPTSWALDPGVRYYAKNVARAKGLLADAGYSHVDLTLLSTTGNDERERLETLVQSDLRAIGIDVTIKNVAAPLLLATAADGGLMMSGKFQMILFAFQPRNADPDDRNYVSSSAIPPNGLNVAGYRNDYVTRWTQGAATVYDRRARAALYALIQRRLIRDLPFYTINWAAQIDAYTIRLHGVRPAPFGSDFWNVGDWSIETPGGRARYVRQ